MINRHSPSPRLGRAAVLAVSTAALVTAGVGVAVAGPGRRIELGGFVGLDYFGDEIELGNSWAPEQVPGTSFLLGGRGGLVLAPDLMPDSGLDPQLGLEAEARLALGSTGHASEGGRDSYFAPVLGWRLHALLRLRHGGLLIPHLVAGAGGETVLSSSPFMERDTDPAYYWGPGLTWRVSSRIEARVDLRHALAPGRAGDLVSTFELQFGLVTGWDLAGGAAQPARPRDTDGDGIVDREDRCVTEPETVNRFDDDDGCPDLLDRDGDGVRDAVDACVDAAETPNAIDDDDGCPEHDPDGDGLVGSRDGCPVDAEDFDKFEDEDGCPDRDNDADTRPDVSDACRDQPETYNGFDDDDGCPDELPRVVKEFTGVIEGITFELARARIQPRSKQTLGKAAALLREYASVRIRIEGHTDDRGPRAKNVALSQKRADAVKWYLVDQGIAADRIETVGRGPEVPRVPNKNAKARAKNRRIEFHVVFQDPTQNVPPLTEPTPAPAPAAPAGPPAPPAPPAAPLSQP